MWSLRRSAAEAPAGVVRLIPWWDEYLLGWKDRDLVAPPAQWRKINRDGGGWLNPTILADGRAVGTWNTNPTPKARHIEVQPFSALSSTVRRDGSMLVELGDQALRGNHPVALLDPILEDGERRGPLAERDRHPTRPAQAVAGRGSARDGQSLLATLATSSSQGWSAYAPGKPSAYVRTRRRIALGWLTRMTSLFRMVEVPMRAPTSLRPSPARMSCANRHPT